MENQHSIPRMAKEAHDNSETVTVMEEATRDVESEIRDAIHSRVNHFKEQLDSLNFEDVRRLLEKDLGLEVYALDVHKRFIKQYLSKCLDPDGDDNVTKNSVEVMEENGGSTGEEATVSPDVQSKGDDKEHTSENEDKTDGSPVLGLLTGHEATEVETEGAQGNDQKEALSETVIKKAIRKRAAYFQANSETITMGLVRRLLEEDLKLEKNTLDPYKKFINKQLDEALNSSEVSEAETEVKKKTVKKNSQSKASKKTASEESSDSLDSDIGETEVKPKKRVAAKGKAQNSEAVKKRKRPEEKKTKETGKKRIKPADVISEEEGGNVSEDSNSQSSAEKSVKKKEAPTPVYGKKVEHLKSIIKSCGMSVPPSVYKKVKQVPENKRETQLIKELEEILSKEGLSANPSEKEIKDVKKRKERAKELEGIDTSNIVSSSRRRSTYSFVAPPKPKVSVESKEDEKAEGTDNDEDNDGENDDDDDEDDDEDEDNDDSQSEELVEDIDEDSD